MNCNSEIKVSICVVTYNQEKYIRQCLQSLVDQVVNFKYEIIVGEDCSSDGTRAIVDEFQSLYPALVFPLYHMENVGAVMNCITCYRSARGKYICHLDGDDYALPSKLQIQVDYLEDNLDCVICSHDMVVVNDADVRLKSSFIRHKSGVNTLMDLYKKLPFFAHSSKMFANKYNDSFWDALHPSVIDIEIHVEQAKSGNIYHIDKCLGAYRYFVGMSSRMEGVNPLLINGTVRIFESALQEPELNKGFIKGFFAKSMFDYAYQSAVAGDSSGLVRYIRFSTQLHVFSVTQRVFYFLSRFPGFIIFLCKIRAYVKGYNVF